MNLTTEDAINSLRGLTKCTCHEAYSGRDLEDPNCLHHEYAEYVEALAARVVALEEVVKAADVLCKSVIHDHDPVQLLRDLYVYEAARAKLEERG